MTLSTTTGEKFAEISEAMRSKMRTLSVSSGIIAIVGLYGNPTSKVQIFDAEFDGLTPVVIVAACFVVNIYTAVAAFISWRLETIYLDIYALEEHISKLEARAALRDSVESERDHRKDHNLGALLGMIQALSQKTQSTKILYLFTEIYLPATFSALFTIFALLYLIKYKSQMLHFG
jgi:hypothetical protein